MPVSGSAKIRKEQRMNMARLLSEEFGCTEVAPDCWNGPGFRNESTCRAFAHAVGKDAFNKRFGYQEYSKTIATKMRFALSG